MVFALRRVLGVCIIEELQRLLPKCNDNTGCWPERIFVVKCLYCADCVHREQVLPSGVMGEAWCVCDALPLHPVSAFILSFIKQQTHVHTHLTQVANT
jgi:hypothetical protein